MAITIHNSKSKIKGYGMKKTILGIFGILVMTVGVWATVPYTFTPSTPAKASEVNANFQALSDKLTILENNISSISTTISGSTSGTSSTDCDKRVFSYTYQYTPSSIGDTITVGGVDYIMVAIPFIEYGTGYHYYIKKPVKKSYSATSTIALSDHFSTSYVQPGSSCYADSFAGFPAKYDNTIYYSTAYTSRVTDPSLSNDGFIITNTANMSQMIKINQTTFYIQIAVKETLQDTPLITNDVNFIDEIDWSVPVISNSLVDNLKTLLNYIEIVKIP